MVFTTKWNPTDATNCLEGILRSHSQDLYCVGNDVETTPDNREGYVIYARGHNTYEWTGIYVRIRPDGNIPQGSVVTVEGDGTPAGLNGHGSEYKANQIEKTLSKLYHQS